MGRAVRRKVIPEKMVELWTANAILAEFGPSTRIWGGSDAELRSDCSTCSG
jgi:hypothetical protein